MNDPEALLTPEHSAQTRLKGLRCDAHVLWLQVPSWRELQREFAARPLPGVFGGLNSRLQRPLAAAVCAHVADLRAAPRATKLDMLQHLLESSHEVVAQCGATASVDAARQDAAVVRLLPLPPATHTVDP